MAENHLFSTSGELKDFLPNTAGEVLDQILPFVGSAEQDFIVRFIGADQFNDLNSKYNDENDDLTDAEAALVTQIQKPLAYFSMMLAVPHLQLLISPSGIRIASTDEYKTAFGWQIENLKEELRNQGYNFIDQLIKYLFSLRSTFTLYGNSDAFKENHESFVNYVSDFNKYYFIDQQRSTFESLRPIIRDLELLQIQENIGKEYYDELKGKILTDNLTADDKVILPWIQAGLVKLTIAEAVKRNVVRVMPNGLVTGLSGAFRETNIDQDYKSSLSLTCDTFGNALLNKTRDYLNKTASASVYATYFGSDTYHDPDIDDPTNAEFVAPAFANDEDGARLFYV